MSKPLYEKIAPGIHLHREQNELNIRFQGFGFNYRNRSFGGRFQALIILLLLIAAQLIFMPPIPMAIQLVLGAIVLVLLFGFQLLRTLFFGIIELKVTEKGIETGHGQIPAYKIDKLLLDHRNHLVSYWAKDVSVTTIICLPVSSVGIAPQLTAEIQKALGKEME